MWAGIKVALFWKVLKICWCATDITNRPDLIPLGSKRLRPHYAKEILKKRSFISAVWPNVHTNPSRKQSFSKTLFKPREFENAGITFSCGWKTCWKQSFSKTDGVTIITWFPWPSFSQTQIQNGRWLLPVFKFLRNSVDGKHLMHFQSETSIFKFLRRNVGWRGLIKQKEIQKFFLSCLLQSSFPVGHLY